MLNLKYLNDLQKLIAIGSILEIFSLSFIDYFIEFRLEQSCQNKRWYLVCTRCWKLVFYLSMRLRFLMSNVSYPNVTPLLSNTFQF